MAKAIDPNNRIVGKICARHPELEGLRFKRNHSCVKCDAEACARKRDQRREAAGKAKFIPMSPEAAKEQIRQRDLLRNRQRRLDPEYSVKQLERKRAWREKNIDRLREVNRAYDAKQMAENIQRRLSKNLRHRLRKAMLGETRGISAVRDLGMSITEFRAYLEARFLPGMSWENYGKWHIDHIRPLKSFDLTDPAQARAACHFSNLQPLWAIDNIRKWSRTQPADSAESQIEISKAA